MTSINIGEITFGDELGRGQFGVVSKGTYKGQEVAVKQVFNKQEDGYDVELYFGREAQMLGKIRHPHCVRFLGVGVNDDDDLYLVTEFVSGGDLRRHLKKNNMPWKDRVRVALEIASALNYLHRNQFIHRDVKTENVLLEQDGTAKLCDFGFSRTAGDDERSRGMTFCGSEWFEAPEIMFCVDYDERIDTFSYGVILCELISRVLPSAVNFKRVVPGFGVNPTEIQDRAEEGAPAELIKIACECTSAEADDRPNMSDVVTRLTNLYETVAGQAYVDRGDQAQDFAPPVVPEEEEEEAAPAAESASAVTAAATAVPTDVQDGAPAGSPRILPPVASSWAPQKGAASRTSTDNGDGAKVTSSSTTTSALGIATTSPPTADAKASHAASTENAKLLLQAALKMRDGVALGTSEQLLWRKFLGQFRSSIKVRDVQLSRSLGRVKAYRNSFTGRDAIDWLSREVAFLRAEATLLAQVLVTCNVIRDSANMALGNKAEFKDSNYAVYRFSDTGIYFNDDEKKKLVK